MIDDFLASLEESLDTLYELMYKLKRQGTEVRIVALIEVFTVDIDHFRSGSLSRLVSSATEI